MYLKCMRLKYYQCAYKDGKMKHWTKVQKCEKVSYNDIFNFKQEVVNQGKSRTKNGIMILCTK